MAQAERKNNFGFVRLLGAIMVIVGHMYVLTGKSAPMFVWESIHGFGVASFFVIGGYLITKSWMQRPIWGQYILKRIFRIFPALIVWVLLTVFVIGPCMTELSLKEYFGNPLTWKYLLNGVLYINYLLPGVFEDNIVSRAVNGSLWCLPVEFLMYLVVPVYISIGVRVPAKRQKWYYVGVTLSVIAARIVWDTWLNNGNCLLAETSYFMQVIVGVFSSTLRIIPFFFAGSLVAACKLEKHLSTQIAIGIILVSCVLSYLPEPYNYAGEYVAISYVVLALAMAENPIFTALNKRDISYGMFLSGFVIQQILLCLSVRKGYEMNVEVMSLLSLGISVFIGGLMEKFVERPLGKFIKR